MSMSSDFAAAAQSADAIYEMLGTSGKSYVFFFFPDNSVCAAKKVATGNRATARLEFVKVNTKAAIRDCLAESVHGTTYQKGQALLKELERTKKKSRDL